MRRVGLVATCAVLVIGAVGCGSTGRSSARSDLIAQLTGSGLSSAVAACVVDAFFEGKTDGELKAFFDREALTDAERQEFTTLGAQCAATAGTVAGSTVTGG